MKKFIYILAAFAFIATTSPPCHAKTDTEKSIAIEKEKAGSQLTAFADVYSYDLVSFEFDQTASEFLILTACKPTASFLTVRSNKVYNRQTYTYTAYSNSHKIIPERGFNKLLSSIK